MHIFLRITNRFTPSIDETLSPYPHFSNNEANHTITLPPFSQNKTAFDFLLYEESIACCLQGRQACGVFLLQSGLAVFAVWGYFCTFAGLKNGVRS